jgi:pyruvate dehydrogenase E1 component alpha subunit
MATHAPVAPEILDLYRSMARIRAFEQAMALAHRDGEIPGVVHLSIGQEAVAAGVCAALRRDDVIASTHRGHGHAIAKGADANTMMAELFGRATGTCRGKGGSMHIADFSVGMLGANGVVGGSLGIACGAAQGARLLGKDLVAAPFFGDGAVNRGPFLEALNWAAIYRLPVVFVCEDNTFSAFTDSRTTTAGEGALARAKAIGVDGVEVDGNDAIAVAEAARAFVARARAGGGPSFLHAKTYRIDGHTIFDPAKYRDPAELEGAKERDPLVILRARAGADPRFDAIDAEARAEMERALAFARSSPWPDPSELYEDVQGVGAPPREERA